MAIELNKNDYDELAESFDSLNCNLNRNKVWGTLSFNCSYNSRSKELVFNDSLDNNFSDEYEIEIDFNKFDQFCFPFVYETSDKISSFSEASSIELGDLHINSNGSCCLGVFPEYQWSGVVGYIEDKVIPFFYWQTFRRVNGLEPWEGLAHGNEGIRESMSFRKIDCAKYKYRKMPCPCGSDSGLRYVNCCRAKDIILCGYLENTKRETHN